MSLPESWIETRLGQVLNRVDVKVDPQASKSSSHFYIGLEHIESHTGRLLLDVDETSEGSDILSIKTAFEKGDILYGKLRPNLNKVYLAEQDGICSTDIWAFRTSSEILPDFAVYYLRSPAVYIRASQLAAGANLPRVSAESFDRIPIPLPTIPEQQRIVDVLRHATQLVELKKSSIELAKKLPQVLFEEMFGIAGATTRWKIESFGNHTTYSKYGPRFPDQGYSHEGVHVLRTTDMNSDGTIRWWEAPKLALTDKQIKEHTLKPGALILSRSGTIGPVALFDGPSDKCVAGAYLIEFGIADSLDSDYLRTLFMTPYVQRMLKKAIRSVAQPNINAPNIKAIPIPVPPIERQREFSRQAKKFRDSISTLVDSSEKIEILAREVSVKAFSGAVTDVWRSSHESEIRRAGQLRDITLKEQSTSISMRAETAPPERPTDFSRPARRWLIGELSEFQSEVWAMLRHEWKGSLIVDDPEIFGDFCANPQTAWRMERFQASPSHIRRALEQLAALGLIAKISLPKTNELTQQTEYLATFRPLREDENTRLADAEMLNRDLHKGSS